MAAFFKKLGFGRNPSEERILELLNNSYEQVEVLGRGTIYIDPDEVAKSVEFKEMSRRLDEIIEETQGGVHTNQPIASAD